MMATARRSRCLLASASGGPWAGPGLRLVAQRRAAGGLSEPDRVLADGPMPGRTVPQTRDAPPGRGGPLAGLWSRRRPQVPASHRDGLTVTVTVLERTRTVTTINFISTAT